MPIILNGGQTATGTATTNAETDSFLVNGSGNLIATLGGGNLDVTGGLNDTHTTVAIGGVGNPAADQFGDTITIALGGFDNVISGGPLNDAMVNVTVSGTGGSNLVNLDNSGDGTTTIALGGLRDKVYLNGDATNAVTLGGGMGLVAIGAAGDDDFGFTSTVQLNGSGNVLHGGDENFTVGAGTAGGNFVRLGNGQDSVALSGGSNRVTVGDGSTNIIRVTGDQNTVSVGSGTNVISATGNSEIITITSGDRISSTAGADSVALTGTGDKVTEHYQGQSPPANVAVFGSTGGATISLDSGTDYVSAGGAGNRITLGNGSDTIYANGNHNTISVGAGSDTIFDTGMHSTITIQGGPGSDSSTTVGNNDRVIASNGVQNVSAMSNDTISLNATNIGSKVTFGGVYTSATILNDGDVRAEFGAQGTGNTLTIQADAMGDYTGTAVINDLLPANGTLILSGFTGGTPYPLTSAANIQADFAANPVAGGYELTTPGGGHITLHAAVLSASMFGT